MKIIGLIILIGVIVVIGVLAWHGVFSQVIVGEQEDGPYTMAYENYTGPYQKTGPVFERVTRDVTAAGIASSIGIGIYFDDPSKVAADKLRSKCGVVIAPEDAQALAGLAPRIQTETIARGRSLFVEIPIRSPLSYMIGPMKAYPALQKYAEPRGLRTGQVYELYDMPARKTRYCMRIA